MALEFIAGCLGGCAGVAVGHPFDTVKVRLQTQDFHNPKYRGTWHCITDTIKHESLRGLYKGMSSPMAGVAFVNAIVFGVHGNMVKHIQNPDSLRSQVLCGATAGLSQSIVSSPMELVKTRVQLQTESCVTTKSLSCAASSSSTVINSRSYASPMDCIKKIVTTEGWRGMFRGQFVTILRDVPGFATYFLSYEYLTRMWASADGSVSPAAVLAGGGFAGAFSWVCTYPIDVVKSRLQADGIGGVNKYRGIADCLKASIASEGAGVLFRGLNSSLLRAFPSNAATFAVVTWTMKNFQGQQEEADTHQTWREVLAHGEALVQAAAIPAPLQLSFTTESSWRTAVSFLPQVMAASKQTEEGHEEEHHETRCQCWQRHRSVVLGKLPNLLGSVCRCHEALTSWRARQKEMFAAARLHHNLSIVL
ncbi:Mitochondrial basic amino acids transporter [Chionoecetes opilio]|uniref:Mitochondrial basic amino acids transporter n=1 Tax=Chionoecetes opilio TaxID=41210 RepID=A0A8J4Y212_CHIOP|nr:Mitochondrial basic amino acids transporter [Chionoecetes opilio]